MLEAAVPVCLSTVLLTVRGTRANTVVALIRTEPTARHMMHRTLSVCES